MKKETQNLLDELLLRYSEESEEGKNEVLDFLNTFIIAAIPIASVDTLQFYNFGAEQKADFIIETAAKLLVGSTNNIQDAIEISENLFALRDDLIKKYLS